MHDCRRTSAREDAYSSTRDFDYSEGDEVAAAVRQSRREIADQIRSAAAADRYATPAVQAAYRRAAELAEGSGATSADEQRAGRQSSLHWPN